MNHLGRIWQDVVVASALKKLGACWFALMLQRQSTIEWNMDKIVRNLASQRMTEAEILYYTY